MSNKSIYAEDINKMQWSYSRLSAFDRCKYEFYLGYIIHDDDLYLSEGNFYAESGSFVHEILAKIFSGEMTLDEAAEYYVDNFDDYICYTVKESIMKKTFESCADYFATEDFDWLKDFDILGVELEVDFEIEGYKFIGFIDLLLRDKSDGQIVIADHKSAAYPFKKNGDVKANSKHSFESYRNQMYLYAYSVNELYGELPKVLMWNHFKENKRAVIPFSENEYQDAISWAVSTIKAIEQEEEYAAAPNFFYCRNLCSFRSVCEYATETLDE